MAQVPLPVTARLADNLLDGHLHDLIAAERQGGTSWDRIAREIWLRTDREIDVTGLTVQTWARKLGIESVEVPA